MLEANAEPGGAVRTAEITAPGFRNDLFSAFYPLAAASPVMRALDLEAHGLTWTHAPDVLAHPLVDRPAAVLSRDLGVHDGQPRARRTGRRGGVAADLRALDARRSPVPRRRCCRRSRPFAAACAWPAPPARVVCATWPGSP